MRMGETKPRTEGPGGEFDVQRSVTDVASDAAGSATGSTATLAVVAGRPCAASDDALTATMPL